MDEAEPEMLRAPLENVVLKSKMLNMGEPMALLALCLDPPDLSNLERTILTLKESGALLNKDGEDISLLDGELTGLGTVMGSLPVDVHITKLIVLGHVFSVLREALIIGASMAVKNMFSAPFQMKLQSYTGKLAWALNSCSDPISFLHVYNTWMSLKANNHLKGDAAEKHWARRNYLQIRVLREIEALVHEMTGRLRKLGIAELRGPNRVQWNDHERALVIKIILAGAFYPNYYTKFVKVDKLDDIKALGGLDPTKTVYLQGWPINQPGQLYAKRIQNYFSPCVNSKVAKILVSFDKSTKVYVQFVKNEAPVDDDKNEEPGEISLSVYSAIKLRHINAPLEVPILPIHVAKERAEMIELKDPVRHMVLRNDDGVMKRRPDLALRPVLPGLDISHLPLIIRRVRVFSLFIPVFLNCSRK